MKISPAALIATIRLNMARRPLLHPAMASEWLEISQQRLNYLIEAGEIPWAWSFATGKTRQEVRLLAASVAEKATGTIIPAIGSTRNLKLPEVIGLILPQVRQSLRGTELQRLFHVSPDNVRDLHKAGAIKRVSEKLPAVGPNASPRFTRDSVVKLLEKRRIA